MILMYPYFIALYSYLFINKSVHMLYIYSHYLMKLRESFFFLQAHAGIFFSTSISCMNFFLDLTSPLPGYLMVHPLSYAYAASENQAYRGCSYEPC